MAAPWHPVASCRGLSLRSCGGGPASSRSGELFRTLIGPLRFADLRKVWTELLHVPRPRRWARHPDAQRQSACISLRWSADCSRPVDKNSTIFHPDSLPTHRSGEPVQQASATPVFTAPVDRSLEAWSVSRATCSKARQPPATGTSATVTSVNGGQALPDCSPSTASYVVNRHELVETPCQWRS